MQDLRPFAAAALGVVLACGTAAAQPPSCYAPTVTYYAAPAYSAAPATVYYAPPVTTFYPAYTTYAPSNVVYGPAGVAYRTSSYTGYYPTYYPPGSGTVFRSFYGGAVLPSTSYYLPGSSVYTPSFSNTPGFNRVFLTTGDFHY